MLYVLCYHFIVNAGYVSMHRTFFSFDPDIPAAFANPESRN